MVKTKMAFLFIEHNHGFLELRDVELVPYTGQGAREEFTGYTAHGTVMDGATTSRLFHATSTTRDKAGEIREYDIWTRVPYCVNAERDEWRVSCVFCG